MLNLKEINLLQGQNEGLKKQNQELQQENARLKEEMNYLKDRVKGEIHLGNRYKEDFAEQVKESEKFKQTLQEIKEIAERELSLTDKDDELYDVFSEILQKIAEVSE